jgi:hypothetical protein
VDQHPEADLMDPDDIQAVAARDQLWASLRVLLPEIEALAAGSWDGSQRQRDVTQLLARIVAAELHYRADAAAGLGE